MKIIQAIQEVVTETEFREFCDNNPHGGVANAQVGLRAYPDGVYQIHLAGCPTLKGKHHVEGQADTKYRKYVGTTPAILHWEWPMAGRRCSQCPKE